MVRKCLVVESVIHGFLRAYGAVFVRVTYGIERVFEILCEFQFVLRQR